MLARLRELDQRLNLKYLRYRWRREPREIMSFLLERKSLRPQTRFSIVVPCYGIKLIYVVELIASLEAQTYRNWELCIADDGDPDPEVWDFFLSLKKTWGERLKLLRHEKNLGICAATRSALSLAVGDFVVFVDADDLLHKEALRLMAYRIAEFSDCDFLYSDHDFMTDWGWRIFPLRKPDWSPELLLGVNYINHITAVRRDLLGRFTDFFPDHLNGGQDTDFVLKMIARARRCLHVPFILYHWRTRPGSVAASVDAKPWAFAAGAKARSEYVENLGLDLRYENRRGLILENPAQVSVVTCGAGKLKGNDWCETLLKHIDQAQLIRFAVEGEKPLSGDPDLLSGYAVLAKVGAAFPFIRSGLRAAYTPGENRGEMRAVRKRRSAFSHFTGNVLTGPLHGLTIQSARLAQALQALANHPEFKESALTPSEFGASLGLILIRLGFRNVSVDGAYLAGDSAETIEVPRDLWLAYDNYL